MNMHVPNNDGSDNGHDDDNDDEYHQNKDKDDHGFDATMTETDVADRRDEVGEVRKMSSQDTFRLRLWRLVVTGVLLLTAFAVTFTTYTLLKQQEDENFQTAVRFFVVVVMALVIWNYHAKLAENSSLPSLVHTIICILLQIVVCTICTYRGGCRC